MREPVLTPEDHRIWRQLERTALAWSQSRTHRRRVDKARAVVDEMATRFPNAYVAWSGGKDSTALAHFVSVECGAASRAFSIKDDLDFPGEVEYVEQLAAWWWLDTEIVRPPFSLQQWLIDHPEVMARDDHHSRSAALSREAFYPLVERINEERGGVYLGLRSEESHGRRMNRAKRGTIYEQSSGQTVCQPLCDWAGLDVFAYLLSRRIDPLHVYRCVRLHKSPWLVRKSWWVPCGSTMGHTGATWLRTYYPSLYRRLCELLPDAVALA